MADRPCRTQRGGKTLYSLWISENADKQIDRTETPESKRINMEKEKKMIE